MHATANIPVHVTPRTVRTARTMARIRQADAAARYLAARRREAARHGYRGPLTRAELAAQAARAAS
jgi:hypothetical protein